MSSLLLFLSIEEVSLEKKTIQRQIDWRIFTIPVGPLGPVGPCGPIGPSINCPVSVS